VALAALAGCIGFPSQHVRRRGWAVLR
jgi:hypothetical protein